jgi:hypothetical protein
MNPTSLRRGAAALAAAATALLVGGCAASASPDWDSVAGEASRVLRTQQTLDPAAASRHGQTVTTMDGRTVLEAGQRHVDTFKAPPPSNVTNINVGGGGAGGAAR